MDLIGPMEVWVSVQKMLEGFDGPANTECQSLSKSLCTLKHKNSAVYDNEQDCQMNRIRDSRDRKLSSSYILSYKHGTSHLYCRTCKKLHFNIHVLVIFVKNNTYEHNTQCKCYKRLAHHSRVTLYSYITVHLNQSFLMNTTYRFLLYTSTAKCLNLYPL